MIAAKPSRLRLDTASRAALLGFLERPRYEVLPTDEAQDLVARNLPTEVTVTITSSPRRGIEATLSLAEKLAETGYSVVPHLAARLVRDAAHLQEIRSRLSAIGGRVFVVAGDSQEAAGGIPCLWSLGGCVAARSPGADLWRDSGESAIRT